MIHDLYQLIHEKSQANPGTPVTKLTVFLSIFADYGGSGCRWERLIEDPITCPT